MTTTRISRRVNAPRPKVYSALLDPRAVTEISAVHDRLPPGLSPADNEAGWRSSQAKLAAFVEAGS
jgi:hypothetical protein